MFTLYVYALQKLKAQLTFFYAAKTITFMNELNDIDNYITSRQPNELL